MKSHSPMYPWGPLVASRKINREPAKTRLIPAGIAALVNLPIRMTADPMPSPTMTRNHPKTVSPLERWDEPKGRYPRAYARGYLQRFFMHLMGLFWE